MKTLSARILALTWTVSLGLAPLAQPADPPAGDGTPPADASAPAGNPAGPPGDAGGAPPDSGNPSAEPAAPPPETTAPPADAAVPPDAIPAPDSPGPNGSEAVRPAGQSVPTTGPQPEAAPAPPSATAAAAASGSAGAGGVAEIVSEGEKGLRLNLRGAPLELVLNKLSEAAGFIIDLQTEVRGKVDVWSNQPITPDEAVSLLNAALSRNGYAAIRNGRVLTIVSKEEAKTRDIPVVSGNEPSRIPKSEEVVTQIIPVRFINATQLIKDLQPLLPSQTTMTANEGGNALVITDTQINIRRMTEVVKALDTAISSTSAIRVFMLKYADAKALATVIQNLFQTQGTSQQGGNNPMQQFFRGMRGGGNQAGATAGTGSARVSTPRVVATSDDRSNALVVSAPEDQMVIIEDLVKQVDTNVDDITEFRVFHLQYADPQETADLLTELFPDSSTTSSQGGRGQFQFGGGRFGGQSTTPSTRLIKQARVVAVPDLRTGSVIVSAARELIEQIVPIIEALDSDPRRKQKVFVFDVENTDPQTVQNIIQNLFPSQNYSSTANRNTSQQVGNQLNNRATSSSTMQNQGFNNTTQNRTGTGTLR